MPKLRNTSLPESKKSKASSKKLTDKEYLELIDRCVDMYFSMKKKIQNWQEIVDCLF
jgi:hypothetical protein